MTKIALWLSFPLRIIAIFLLLLASSESLAQLCYCPPPGTCGTCSGGFTRFTLKHTGPLRVWVTAEDQGGTIYQGWVDPNEEFMFSGSTPNEKFQGSIVTVRIGGIINAIFGVNCGDEYPGNTSGFFEIRNIISKNGGVVCCLPGTVDTSRPTISGCPTNKTATLPANSCTVPVTWNEPTATDNCGSPSITWTKSHTPNSPFPYGQTTVTYIATDAYGNQSNTCSFTVTVNDITAPVFTTPCPTVIRTADASCQAKGGWTPPTATDNSTCIPTITSTHDPDDVFSIGTTLVTYTATDAKGNKSTCSFNVVVEDKIPPEFAECPTVSAIATTSCPIVDLPTPILTDNCSGNVSYTSSHPDNSEFPIGETLVTYTAVDGSANTAVCTFLVVVSNAEPPEIEGCPGTITNNVTVTENDSVAVSWVEPSATVICGEDSVEKSHAPGSKFPIGTTAVTYVFKDGYGKSSTCTFDVVVLPPDELFGISKAVTPDGDGINDVWLLKNIESFKNNTVVVIDRWGNKIFHATGYDNVRTVWNGTNKNGTVVPTGTYFYTIEVRDQGKVVLKKGFIEVIQ